MLIQKCIVFLLVGVFVVSATVKFKKIRTKRMKKIVDVYLAITWRSFYNVDINSKNIVEYRIERVPFSKHKEAVEFMLNYTLTDEPLTAAFSMY